MMSNEGRLVRWGVILICLLSASLAFADSKNETKKQYDAIVNKLSRDLADGKIDDAAADAKVAEKLDANNPETANLFGVVATKKKDYAEAVSQFNRAITEDPKFYTAKFNFAELLLLQGGDEQAATFVP